MNVLTYLKEHAGKCPAKIAFSDDTDRCTYEELWENVQRMAFALRTAVPGQHAVPVGVFAGHDVKTIQAFLAIAASGHFYVPMDPTQPKTKLAKILQDAQMALIIGREGEEELLPEESRRSFSCFSELLDGPIEKSDVWEEHSEPLKPTDGSRPLYMIYTSGSTGMPKGVVKSHEAVIDFIEAYVRTFDFSHEEVIGNQTPFYFDASAKDIYLTLKLGATMEIIPEEKFLLPPALIRYLNEKRITFISWVPSALSLVTQFNTFSELVPETLKKVFFVGELFPIKQFRRWQEALPDLEYVNLYGATELAGICCYYRIPPNYTEESIPIGKPLDNCRVFLADQTSEEDHNAEHNDASGDTVILREPHKTGEIYIASKALAMEYYRDPEKTERAFFVQDGERYFRSGDLAWYDEEGNLHFAARSDSQIKHMGHRIELGEIESVCQSLPSLEKACCLYDAQKKRIWLFCQLIPGAQEDMKSILLQLKEELPFYMVPQRVRILEKLPLNANGKTDRQMLRAQMYTRERN